ncbi:MAG: class II fructose-bisphosphate aldolase [bacterium]|nr:class II fructose-bisphosphate aldolase [bacterium]
MVTTLKDALDDARKRRIAVGHFNISDSTQLNAIASAAQELNVPVLVGVSDGEREFIGAKKAVAMVEAAREEFGIPIFLNADHTHDVAKCKALADMGFDSVIFDGSKLPAQENIEKTREVVAYVRASGREVLIEGELGYIGSSSKLLDAIPDDVRGAMTTPEDALHFVRETGVDLLAPSVGNLHGMLKGRENPALDIARIRELSETVDVPMVLHGGSGISDEDFTNAIAAGMTIVHINTEIRVAYRRGIEEGFAASADEVVPYHYLDKGRDAVKEVVENRLKLFGKF